MIETQESIAQWGWSVFGRPRSDAVIVARANLEMAELIVESIAENPSPEKLVKEAADIVIVLTQMCANHGLSLQEAIDAKMAINRARKWAVTADGVGQHIE